MINSFIFIFLCTRYEVVRDNWYNLLDPEIAEDLRSRRTYNERSVSGLLRALRNKKHHYQVNNIMSKDRVNSDIFGAHGQLLQIHQLNDNNINETSKHSGSQENNSASKRASTGLDSAQAILAQDLKKRMRVM